jgi:hypothetical protein
MTTKFPCDLIILIVAVFYWSGAAAQDSTPTNQELVRLRAQYEKAVSTALAPIQKRYTEELRVLQNKLTKSGDLNGALAAKSQLDALIGENNIVKFDLAKALENTKWVWRSDHPEETISFQDKGIYVFESPAKGQIQGNFTVRGDRTIEVLFESSVLILQFDGGLNEYSSEVTSGALSGRKFIGRRVKR